MEGREGKVGEGKREKGSWKRRDKREGSSTGRGERRKRLGVGVRGGIRSEGREGNGVVGWDVGSRWCSGFRWGDMSGG